MKFTDSVIVLCILGSFISKSHEKPSALNNNNNNNRYQVLKYQYGQALEAIFGMGIRLQVLLGEEHSSANFLISPISATAVIGQLMLGSDGKFREKLYQLLSLPKGSYENDKINYYDTSKGENATYILPYSTLHLQLRSLLKALEGGNSAVAKLFTLKQKSAVFTNDRVKLSTEFERNLRAFYSADLQSLDFTNQPGISQKIINDWASQNTNGLIKSILQTPPSASTASIFANALYFLAEWRTPFSHELNRLGGFNISENNQVQVTYMVNFIEKIPYAESDEYRVISLPYKNDELGMYILLPKPGNANKYNIKEFAKNLKVAEVIETVNRATLRDVTVKIPKMSLSNSFSLLKPLKKYRDFELNRKLPNSTDPNKIAEVLEETVDAFTNASTPSYLGTSDLYLTKGTSDGGLLKIDDIVQQIVFSVNEKGTEAAAVTASTIDYISSKNFAVDRPFLFFIRHEATSATLFWGAITNPVL